MDDFDEVKIGIAYELDGEKNYDSFPGEVWKQFQNMFNSLDVYYAIKTCSYLIINGDSSFCNYKLRSILVLRILNVIIYTYNSLKLREGSKDASIFVKFLLYLPGNNICINFKNRYDAQRTAFVV